MSSDAEEYVRYRIANTPVLRHPFPHFYVSQVFPEDFYGTLMEKLPPTAWYTPIDETGTVQVTVKDQHGNVLRRGGAPAYPERFVMDLDALEAREQQEHGGEFWMQLSQWLMGDEFRNLILEKFRPDIQARFGTDAILATKEDARLVRDFTRYAIAPHADSERKLVSLLFYLPVDERYQDFGTAIYSPLDRDLRAEGGRHYAFEQFKEVVRMPFVPNSLLAFLRTDQSFHGVAKILEENVERNLLLYNIYVRQITRRARPRRIRWPWAREQAA